MKVMLRTYLLPHHKLGVCDSGNYNQPFAVAARMGLRYQLYQSQEKVHEAVSLAQPALSSRRLLFRDVRHRNNQTGYSVVSVRLHSRFA